MVREKRIVDRGRVVRLIKKPRMVNLRLRLNGEGEVVVSGPWHASFEAMLRFYSSQDQFVAKVIAERERQDRLPDRWDEKTTLFWHGELYPLHIVTRESGPDKMCFREGHFIWETKAAAAEKALVLYRNVLSELLHAYAKKRLAEMGIDAQLRVRTYRSRWGVCAPESRTISLNVNLALLPAHFTDYLLAHEVAHLEVPHHGRAFYSHLSTLYPEWQATRQALKMYKHMWFL